MKRKSRWIAPAIIVVALLAAVLVPGSPVNLTSLWTNEHAGRTRSAWIRDLRHDDPTQRLEAIIQVGKIGPAAADAVPDLAKLLRPENDADTRIQASLTLTKMAPASRGALPELVGGLTDPEPLVRFNAVLALRRLGTEARTALPDMLAALDDPANHTNARVFAHTVHQSLLRAIGTVGAGAAEAVPPLTLRLAISEPAAIKKAALAALQEVGAVARPAGPSIRRLLKDSDPEVRELAEEALAALELPKEGDTAAQADVHELPEDDRRYLWKIENAGNVLGKHGFGPLAKALQSADRAALAAALAPEFTAADLDAPKTVRAARGAFDLAREESSGRPARALDREQFLDRLLAFRQRFRAAAPGVKFNMMTLSPAKYGDLDSPTWTGAVQLRLHGESEAGAPAEVVAVLRYEIAKPVAADLARPGWIRRAEIVQVLTATARHPLFVDATAARGLRTAPLHDNWTRPNFMATTGGAFVTDYDRDGWLDLLITDPSGPTLYRGAPDGKFVDVTEAMGLKAPFQDVTAVWVDIDGDGWDDLIANRHVYRNDQGRRFVDVTERCHPRPPDGFANILVADYDRDGKLDLYFARPGPPGSNSWLDPRSSDPNGNYLFRNLGDFRFEDVTAKANAAAGRRSSFTAAWLDADSDGWPDLFVPNEFGDGVLLRNNRKGAFESIDPAKAPADFGTMGLAVGDLDNDGHVDLYCNNMYSKAGTRVIGNMRPDTYPAPVMERLRRFVAGSQLHRNRGNLQFEQVGAEKKVAAVGWAYGVSLADFDNDGYLDIYATAGYVSRDRNEPDG